MKLLKLERNILLFDHNCPSGEVENCIHTQNSGIRCFCIITERLDLTEHFTHKINFFNFVDNDFQKDEF